MLFLFVFATMCMSSSDIIGICRENVPGWMGGAVLTVRPMLEGLSNQLYRVDDASYTVLFRIYGEHVSRFYSQTTELEVFESMSEFGMGPKLIAQGLGWRIEEFYRDHAVLRVANLVDPVVYLQVARLLGKLHTLPVSESIRSHSPVSIFRLDLWTEAARDALTRQASTFEIPQEVLNGVTDMLGCLNSRVEDEDQDLGYQVVFSHNDLQENNLLSLRDLTDIRMIDFEYADMNFQAADIGNFFSEFTIDYIVSDPPGFTHSEDEFPSISVQIAFITEYLHVYLKRAPTQADIQQLAASVATFRQLSHLLWGMWAIVRSEQKAETSFDFLAYAKSRFDAFIANAQNGHVVV